MAETPCRKGHAEKAMQKGHAEGLGGLASEHGSWICAAGRIATPEWGACRDVALVLSQAHFDLSPCYGSLQHTELRGQRDRLMA